MLQSRRKPLLVEMGMLSGAGETSNIRQRMEVLGLSGGYVGIVDAVEYAG